MLEFRDDNKAIHLLGTRGVPADHGGFETFVARLAPYLAERGWDVFVYCQMSGSGPITTDSWRGATRVLVPVRGKGTLSTIVFDFRSMLFALRYPGLLLSFGYPTGAFGVIPWLRRRCHLINMDGIEWKRSQFGWLGRIAYYCNERFAALFGTHLIADHPEIARHLYTRTRRDKVTTIAYGAERPVLESTWLESQQIVTGAYCLVVARPEPDNSILEIVRAFSSRKRNLKLVVLGNYDVSNPYHRKVLEAASTEVIFPGAIYQAETLSQLRSHCQFYIHGHRVGGTNPSLVESLGAGNAVIAHDNQFNRWVAADAAIYFSSEDELSSQIHALSNGDR